MEIKIIGAGFGRTGTMSLYTALNQLGFPCYHMAEVNNIKKNRGHLDFWLKVARAQPNTQHDWQTVLNNYSAVVDFPTASVWSELADAYPDAKIVLSLHPRGGEAWYKSARNTIYFTESMWQFKVLASMIPFARKLGKMCHLLVWQRSLRGTMQNKQRAIARYQEHIDEVIAQVPADQLLVYSVDQGWKPLCHFLGVDIPNTEFPNINDSAEFQQRKKISSIAAYSILATGVCLVTGMMYTASTF